MRSVVMPKGAACALHLTPEYEEGKDAEPRSVNPYDFWDEYEKHYAFDIGNQTPFEYRQKWLQKQIEAANEEIETWSDVKKQVMLRPDLD